MTETRTVIQVGNSVAVTLPPKFVRAGEKVAVSQHGDALTVRPLRAERKLRVATNNEVARKFKELERRYGKLYDDLARIP